MNLLYQEEPMEEETGFMVREESRGTPHTLGTTAQCAHVKKHSGLHPSFDTLCFIPLCLHINPMALHNILTCTMPVN